MREALREASWQSAASWGAVCKALEQESQLAALLVGGEAFLKDTLEGAYGQAAASFYNMQASGFPAQGGYSGMQYAQAQYAQYATQAGNGSTAGQM